MRLKPLSIAWLSALCVLLSFPLDASSTDYYLSSKSGADVNDGLSPSTPWRSLARANRSAFRPGDRVLLRAGETWHEQLRPMSSGTQSQPIAFGSYGAGAHPILEGDSGHAPGTAKPAGSIYIAIDNNDQSHVIYQGLELRHVLEGLRLYVWSAAVRDITIRNCQIQVDREIPGAPPSAAVYANVRTGTIRDLRILENRITPYPKGLEHWGIYLVSGVQHFLINGNTLGPSGEDGITVWHSAYGEITGNQGGGDGENTIDVKDSHDVKIANNIADLDQEYNIVVHSVDAPDSTYKVNVTSNRCSRGGQGGQISAGIALLFVQDCGIEDNDVLAAYGSGILIKDAEPNPRNWASRNRLTGNGTRQKLPAIVLQGTSTAKLEGNQIALNSDEPK